MYGWRALMIQTLFVFLMGWAGLTQAAYAVDASQVRAEGEDWQEALKSYEDHQRTEGEVVVQGRSAKSVAVSLSLLDLSSLSEWTATDPEGVMQSAFEKVRDLRFLSLPDRPEFARRLSWLYPDDGCFARAEWMGIQLETWGLPRPKKIFIFGNLSLKTSYSPRGRVYWWYHVVPVFLAQGKVYVFDASVESQKPLPLLDWIRTLVRDPGSVKAAICDPTAYEPSSACHSATPDSADRARRDQKRFLQLEWDRLLNLGRNPWDELGENPPWKESQSAVSEGLSWK